MYLLVIFYNTGHAELSNCKDQTNFALHTVINFVVVIIIIIK